METLLSVSITQHDAKIQLSKALKPIFKSEKPVKIICIGTDRLTGDSLGPLVGNLLQKASIDVMGTLKNPVTAIDIEKVLEENNGFKDYCVLAIDACLGRSENVGEVKLREGSFSPGSGVGKDLPPVGDFNIIGIVNIGGFMEYMMLQNTRLNLVYEQAELISGAIQTAITSDFVDDEPELFSFEWACKAVGHPLPKSMQIEPEGEKTNV
ncbi:MAG TPA: spore protease YyaC [Firmicutes bacterium]|jgi:putative sporulation protein YyaC|nr:spore protease YyaC [Bacillota bacterium]